MNFNFFMPTKLVSGRDCVKANSQLLAQLGKRCLVVTSGSAAKKSGALADLESALKLEGISYSIHDTVLQNPLLQDAFDAGAKARNEGADFIIGVGGGSPQDAAKVVAIYGANDIGMLEVFDYKWKNPPLPIVAIGTTAGTGSEVTQYAVMTTPEGLKRTVSGPFCFPTVSFGDSKYTFTLPLYFTISTALDALSHVVEGYYSTAATEISDLFALEAISTLKTALGDLLKIRETGGEISEALREQLYYSSIIAGITIAQTGTTYCHALGYFLSEDHNLPHGIACSIYLSGYIKRAKRLMPQRADKLEKAIGLSSEELSSLVIQLTGPVSVTLTPEQVNVIVERSKDVANLIKTAPAGLSAQEATEIMTELFVK